MRCRKTLLLYFHVALILIASSTSLYPLLLCTASFAHPPPVCLSQPLDSSAALHRCIKSQIKIRKWQVDRSGFKLRESSQPLQPSHSPKLSSTDANVSHTSQLKETSLRLHSHVPKNRSYIVSLHPLVKLPTILPDRSLSGSRVGVQSISPNHTEETQSPPPAHVVSLKQRDSSRTERFKSSVCVKLSG